MNLFSYLQLASIAQNIRKGAKEKGEISKEGKELIEKIVKQLNATEQKIITEKKPGPPQKLTPEEMKGLEDLAEADRHYIEFCVWYTTKNLPSVDQWLNELKEALERAGYQTICIDAKLEDRGVFGVSQRFGEYLFEVGLEFDPYFNLPIIPGPSLKGATRSMYEVLREGNWPSPEEIFGDRETAGKVVFLDAYPIRPGRGKAILFPDVITPHYKGRSGEDLLEEFGWEPRPITYLCLAPGTTFRFIAGVVKDFKHVLEQTLLETLTWGLGAKTAVGYGRFRVEEGHVS